MENQINTRELIVDMLMEIYAGNEYSHILIRSVLNKYEYLPESDRAFVKKVTEGTLERGITIDYILNQYSKVPVNKMKPFIRSLMRMSVYQIVYLSKVPDSAACNEAVKLAVKRKFGPLKGFVNGVLRNIAREKDKITFPSEGTDLSKALEIKYSLPKHLVELFLEEQGEEKTKQIGESLLQTRNLCIRMREHLTEEEKQSVFSEWGNAGVDYQKHPWLSYAYIMKNTENPAAFTGFQKGLYQVQDVSSMLVCEIAGIKEGDYCIDVCSAPGGKALHACEKLNKTGTVDARDVSVYKTDMILANKERMQAENLTVKVWDATVCDKDSIEKADVLLADVPCSGLGVMGKKPDIKYNIKPEQLESITELQKEIIDTVNAYVKPGGVMIYSTCTVRNAENKEMVSYIEENYDFELEDISDFLPEELRSEETKKGYLQLLPSEWSDGFFMAKLRKKK